jgi:hypothetical protein
MKMFIVKANNDVSVFDSREKAERQLSEMCFHKQWCTASWRNSGFICECGLIEDGSITEVNLNE